MRRTQSNWRRCWSRKWLKKFIAISLTFGTTICGLPELSSAAAPGKKPPKTKSPEKAAKSTEKVARKTDDSATKTAAKTLPKAIAENHPLKPAIDKAEASLKVIAEVKDYSTILFKREMVQNKEISQTLTMKVRHEPFSVYLKFEEPHAGREVIYVDGLNKGKFLVHETGFKALAGTLSFLPNSKEALAENRYPVTQAGMEKMLSILIDQWKADAEYQEVKLREAANVKVGEVPCDLVETIHPQARDYFKFHKTRLFIDKATHLPIRLEQYGWPEQDGGEAVLMEEYTYTAIKTNIGLTDKDFDKSNPAYEF